MDYQINIIGTITGTTVDLNKIAREVCDVIRDNTMIRNPYVEVKVLPPISNDAN